MFKMTSLRIAAVSAVLSLTAWFAHAGSMDDAIIERIKPAGSVCLEGQECAKAVAQAASSGPKSAKEVYDSGCAACHSSGAAGAPKFRDAADWGARLAQGMDVLYDSGINGKAPAMPAKGLCPTCSDDEIKAAVDYMIEGL